MITHTPRPLEAITTASTCRLPTATTSPLPTRHLTLATTWQLPSQPRCPSWRRTCSRRHSRCPSEGSWTPELTGAISPSASETRLPSATSSSPTGTSCPRPSPRRPPPRTPRPHSLPSPPWPPAAPACCRGCRRPASAAWGPPPSCWPPPPPSSSCLSSAQPSATSWALTAASPRTCSPATARSRPPQASRWPVPQLRVPVRRPRPSPPLTEASARAQAAGGPAVCYPPFPLCAPPPPLFPNEDFKHSRRGLEENAPFQLKQAPCGGPASVFTCAPWHWCCSLLAGPPSPKGFLSGSAQWLERIDFQQQVLEVEDTSDYQCPLLFPSVADQCFPFWYQVFTQVVLARMSLFIEFCVRDGKWCAEAGSSLWLSASCSTNTTWGQDPIPNRDHV